MPTGPHGSDTPRPDSGAGAASDVRLEVPAEARFARVVRVAVSAAAVQCGLDVTAIEDLRIAVDESLILLLREGAAGTESGAGSDAGSQPDRSVVVTIHDCASRFRVDLQLRPRPEGHPGSSDDLEALSRFTALIPPRVAVPTVDPTAGVVHLHLA